MTRKAGYTTGDLAKAAGVKTSIVAEWARRGFISEKAEEGGSGVRRQWQWRDMAKVAIAARLNSLGIIYPGKAFEIAHNVLEDASLSMGDVVPNTFSVKISDDPEGSAYMTVNARDIVDAAADRLSASQQAAK